MHEGRPNAELLRNLVPLESLAPRHLDILESSARTEFLVRGRVLWPASMPAYETVYLLSGALTAAGKNQVHTIRAGSEAARHAIDPHNPRQFTVAAEEDSRILRIDAGQHDTMLSWSHSAGGSVIDFLENVRAADRDWLEPIFEHPVFCRVSPGNLRRIMDTLQPVECAAGEVVIREGEPGDCCYFIREGQARVTRKGGDAGPGGILAELGTGASFGTDALLTESVRNATVSMKTSGVLMRMDKRSFLQLLREPVVEQLGYASARRRIDSGALWLDVRTPAEYQRIHLRGAPSMPLNLLRLKAWLLDRQREYIAYCDTGRRGVAASYLLCELGFTVFALREGINGLDTATCLQEMTHETDYVLHRNGRVTEHPLRSLF